MKYAMERGCCLAVLEICLIGCRQPYEMRHLTCTTRPARVEARSFDSHDPFADESAGPETFTRPRAFQEPRSDTRKTNDLRFLQAMRDFSPRGTSLGDPVNPVETVSSAGQPFWKIESQPTPISIIPKSWEASATRYDVVRPQSPR